MATNVIMPALGMAQETGRLIRWLVEPGAAVNKGDPLMEIETDKAVVEVQAPASGYLEQVTAAAGDEVPVGQVIAVLLTPSEAAPAPRGAAQPQLPNAKPSIAPPPAATTPLVVGRAAALSDSPAASRLALRVAAEHGVDIHLVAPHGERIDKADVLAYILERAGAAAARPPQRILASPKARGLASQRGIPLATVRGTGPEGAVQTGDVLAAAPLAPEPAALEALSTRWRLMADRLTQSWTTVPHFYLLREVNAEALVAWRGAATKHSESKITFTDLLIRIAGVALARHPRLNASWRDGALAASNGIHVGIAVAADDGLIVPIVHHADRLTIGEIALRRQDLTARAQTGRLRPEDLSGGSFTISNLGMYGVDAFNAIVNPPQAALLAVGRIADRVVAINGQPAVRPTVILSLSCDHRVIDGARGAAFLDTLAGLIEQPLALLE